MVARRGLIRGTEAVAIARVEALGIPRAFFMPHGRAVILPHPFVPCGMSQRRARTHHASPARRKERIMAHKDPYRIYLSEDQIPTSYYNL